MSYEPKYLIMVTTENNNKYYEFLPSEDCSSFTVRYGRVGQSSFQTMTYSISDWNKKYNEKIKKGYVDQTCLRKEIITKIKNKEYIDITNKSVADIVNRLQTMAKQAVSENYTVSSAKVTQSMVDEAQKIINVLSNISDLNEFNKKLIELFRTIPRKMGNVNDHLAYSDSGIERIIKREQDLLDIMATQVIQNDVEDTDIETGAMNQTILDAMGLKFDDVTNEDIEIIKKQLGTSANRFVKAWRVTNIKTQLKFDKFVKDNNIKDVKLLWHGSKSENFWNIINTGLVLRPNAVRTGSMFGSKAIYFAPKSEKSIGYTSLNGSYWARGNSNSGFLALNEVAYGTPYMVYDFSSEFYNMDYEKLQIKKNGANCLHASANKGMLRNDEIVIYKEEQCTIKYLVEIK